ncbi:hypothetical protein J2X31_000172 [Flavobacterium arsenatis]|uniref:DUF2007 domain-containing protein n=1 Tax=Flavobacterium arsenatis TaxID=1484332 RepID=A0ABU1TJL5_9FLAO|nr:hypothetical protein [Flavobacterium arsenatis]MDR6966179.1 hypothetical protein [Flavobacterium arsenatis]
MAENFTSFRNFLTLNQAQELEFLLNKNNIQTEIGNNVPPVDTTFSGSSLQHQYEIKIAPSDFEKAELLLEEFAENNINEIDKGYYLFDFTNEDLYEVLIKSDEWNIFDYKLAQKILKERGKSIDLEMLESLKKERIKILSQPEENQKPWIVAGYILSFLGGALGILIGYSLWASKKTLPNGQRIYSYKTQDRNHGKTIFYIGIIAVIFFLALNILIEI